MYSHSSFDMGAIVATLRHYFVVACLKENVGSDLPPEALQLVFRTSERKKKKIFQVSISAQSQYLAATRFHAIDNAPRS